MPININTNIPSLQVDRQLSSQSRALNRSFEKLATGKDINRASDNPAGLAIALDLLANADTGNVAARNISDGISTASIADGALQSASDITTRLSELATQASNGTLSSEQRSSLNNEFQALTSELDRISQTTEFNGQKLLTGNTSVALQVGTTGSADSQIALSLPGVSTSGLGITRDLSTQANAQAALDQVKTAGQTVASARGEIGSTVSRLSTAFENIKTSELNQRDAASRILDVDVAKESANLVSLQIRQQAAVAVKAQANILPQLALKLLG